MSNRILWVVVSVIGVVVVTLSAVGNKTQAGMYGPGPGTDSETGLAMQATAFPTNTPRATQSTPNSILPTAVGQSNSYDHMQEIRDHYWLARPFPRDPSNRIHDFASRSYPYGTTAGGQFQTHHGIDIQNALGTSILAVASGQVVYAGDDSTVMFGPRNDFYGNLVIIKHDFNSPDGRPFYTLYGHMSQIDVETGQRVDLLQKIGEVGSSGVALGSHLHLEVRIGDPFSYGSSYNPDLWIRPWPDYGTLIGRVFDADGSRVYDINVTIQPLGEGPDRYTFTYANDSEINSDPYYGEHFSYADLPAGDYQVIVRMRNVLKFKGQVTVVARQTSWLDIQLK
ncbi:MAG: peptidoglycan DD-metalloendopeptidase family protein [Anaerolineae bacterium]|nr:peptidoglycan DD-metalloendopeptidase family protein [Anaerolineae bacterium]